MSFAMTRLNTTLAASGFAAADSKLTEMEDATDALLTRLTARERARLPKPPLQFESASSVLVSLAAHDKPEFAKVAGLDGEAVLEDIANLRMLAPLIARVESFLQKLKDTELQWRAETFEGTMPAYRMAKSAVERDASFQPLVEALDELFARAKKEEEKDKEGKDKPKE